MATFSQQVRDSIKAAKLSVPRLAELSGVTQPPLRRFLAGDGDLNQDSMAKVLRILLKKVIVEDAIPEPEPLTELLTFVNQKERTPQELSSEYVQRVCEGVLDLRSADERCRMLVTKSLCLLKDEHWAAMPTALQRWANDAIQAAVKGVKLPALPDTVEARQAEPELPKDPKADERQAALEKRLEEVKAEYPVHADMTEREFWNRGLVLEIARFKAFCEVYLVPLRERVVDRAPGTMVYIVYRSSDEDFLTFPEIVDAFRKAAGEQCRVHPSELQDVVGRVLTEKRLKADLGNGPDAPIRAHDNGQVGWRHASLHPLPPPKPDPPITDPELLNKQIDKRKLNGGKVLRFVVKEPAAPSAAKRLRPKPRLEAKL